MQQETKPCVAPCAQCSRETGGTNETSGTAPTGPTTPTSHTRPTSHTPADRIADSLGRIADALEALVTTAKEKENLPPTPPIREKETLCAKRAKRAHARERFKKPTVEEVAAHIAAKGFNAHTPNSSRCST